MRAAPPYTTTAAPCWLPKEAVSTFPGKGICEGLPNTLGELPSAAPCVTRLPHENSRPCVSSTPDTPSPANTCGGW